MEQMSETGDIIEWLNIEYLPRCYRMPNILWNALGNLAKDWESSVTNVVNYIVFNIIDSSYIFDDKCLKELVNLISDNFINNYGDKSPNKMKINKY